MNSLEHIEITRELLEGFNFGKVLSNDDPEKLNRVKVRVRGVFNIPIKKEDIPWATPLIHCDIPILGDEVCVIFLNGDIRTPFYFPKTVLDKEVYSNFKTLFKSIVDSKKNSIKSGSSVSISITEPATGSDGVLNKNKNIRLYPEDVATEAGEDVSLGNPSKGILEEVNTEKGKESWSINHTTGTFVEINKEGTVVIHSAKDVYLVSEGNNYKLVGGNDASLVKGNLELKVDGDVKLTVGGNLTIDAAQIELPTGTVTPGTGPFCALPNCVFSGAPHGGNIMIK